MRILAFVDMHGSHDALKRLRKKSKKADLVVCAGDLTVFGNKLSEILSQLSKLKKDILIIPGNHENSEELKTLSNSFDKIEFIDKRSVVLDGNLYLGYGEGAFSTVDKEFEKISKRFKKDIKDFRKGSKDGKVVLITHAPPYKTKLDMIVDEACGNKSLRKFIKKVWPDLVISGHLHENSGKEDKIGRTRLVNPGPYGKMLRL